MCLCEIFRSSRPEVFCEKDVLRNFVKFTGKHLCQSLLFNKVAGGASNFIKKGTLAQVFSSEFCEISKNTFFYRTPLVAAFWFWLSIPEMNTSRKVKEWLICFYILSLMLGCLLSKKLKMFNESCYLSKVARI